MEYEKNYDKNGVYSKKVRAGKRRTYFFDVRTTKGNDYYLTITESKKRFDEEAYDRHKIFVYKEDFMKFIHALEETIEHIKTELLPDYDFDAPQYEYNEHQDEHQSEQHTEQRVVEQPESDVPQIKEHKDTEDQHKGDDAEKWD